MEAIDGLHPIPRDARVTRWCFYYWDFRFVSEEFGGISRGRFMEALHAEGVSCGVGAHGEPIYNEGPFGNPELFDQLGLPRKYLGEHAIDYSTRNCPQAERGLSRRGLQLRSLYVFRQHRRYATDFRCFSKNSDTC